LSPPPKYSYVSIQRPSEVGTTFGMPGRPPPIWLTPPTFSVNPATTSTGALQPLDVVPFHVRWATTCPWESVAVLLSARRARTPVDAL
jgi:hypothetical protein